LSFRPRPDWLGEADRPLMAGRSVSTLRAIGSEADRGAGRAVRFSAVAAWPPIARGGRDAALERLEGKGTA
jgi:hypothetical protein